MAIMVAGSGSYYGGGYRAAPRAVIDDGLLEFGLIGPVDHLRLPEPLALYKKGLHLGHPAFAGRLHYARCRRLQLQCEAPMAYALDGEVYSASQVEFQILPRAQRLVIPQGVDIINR